MFTVDEIAGEYGRTELTKLVNDVEQVIGVRLPGVLGGEIPMTLGTPLPASMRAIEPSRVMKVPTKVFHTLAAMAPRSPQRSVPPRCSAWGC